MPYAAEPQQAHEFELLMRAPYYSSVPVPCVAGRQQAHEFELLTGGMFLSTMTRVVAFHFSLSRSAKP